MSNTIKSAAAALIALAMPLIAWAEGAAPEAQAIIDTLELRTAPQPMADNPNWHPRRVVVMLPPSFEAILPDYEQRLRAAAGAMEVVIERSGKYVIPAETLAGADALIGLCNPATLHNAGPQLLWLHSYTVGMDRCTGLSDRQRATVVFTNNKRLSGPAIAEHTIAMLLGISRGLPAYLQAQSRGEWNRGPSSDLAFGELTGKTMLIAGLGGIGTEIARRAHGLGMRVIATRNSSHEGPEFVDYVGLADELPTLAKQAQVLVNALPLTKATAGLFNTALFNQLPPGAIFLSVGRGRSTVTADLINALHSGQLYGAGLDVTDPEPLPTDSPLWQMKNVIITPHVAATGADTLRRSAFIAVENLRRYAAGEALLNPVDIQAGY